MLKEEEDLKQEAGTRLSIWVPDKDCWLFSMLASEAKREKEYHRRSSKGSIALRILLEHYEKKLTEDTKKKEGIDATK